MAIIRPKLLNKGVHKGMTMARVATREYAASTKERVEDELQTRRHEEYGGLKFGAAFFGWLVATGISVVLTTIVASAGVAIALTQLEAGQTAEGSRAVIGLLGGATVFVISALAYFAGGYVAGRMARFDGARQGLGVWIIGVLAALLAALAGSIFGAQYNVLQQVDLPAIPIDAGNLAAAGITTLILSTAVALLAAILGGKAGERYHKKIDQTGM
jgi:hypothetical protein